MTNSGDVISDVYLAARQREEDASWASSAYFWLVVADVAAPIADRVLREAVDVLSEDDGDASELLGTPQQWAQDTVAQLRASGIDPVYEQPETLASTILVGSYIAAGVSIATLISLCISDWSGLRLTLGLALLPVLLAIAVVVTRAAYGRALQRWGMPRALGCGALALFAVGAVTFVPAFALSDIAVTVHPLWYSVVVVVLIALTVLLQAVLPSAPEARMVEGDWYSVFAARLHERGEHSNREIARMVREAREYVADSGISPEEEFGQPGALAFTMPARGQLKARRTALWWTAGLAVLLLLCVAEVLAEGWAALNWWRVGLALTVTASCVLSWNSWRQARTTASVTTGAR